MVTNEESFNKVNELDHKLNDSLLSNQKELEKENNNKSQEEEQKRNLENEKNTLSNKNAIVRFFKRKQIKSLTPQITELENSIQNSNLSLDQIEAEITELKNKIKTNEDELIEVCGINLSDYKTIIKQCKDEGLTEEELVEKKATIQSLLSNLNIQGKEQHLLALYEKNGLTRRPIEEQTLGMKM